MGQAMSTSEALEVVTTVVLAAIYRTTVAWVEGRKDCRLLTVIREQHRGHEAQQGFCLRRRAVMARV